jgi:uncharacterized protein (TIRG00374 family)
VRLGQTTQQGTTAFVTRRRLLLSAALVVALVVLLYVGLPRLSGLEDTWGRLQQGDPWWLGVALGLEVLSFCGYVLLLRGVFAAVRLSWADSYAITMAGLVATRLFAAGGAGGIVLTTWALTRLGASAGAAARGMTTFLVALYSVYMAALVAFGLGLYTGLLPGPAPFALTVVPAILGAVVIIVALAAGLVPADLEHRVRRGSRDGTRTAKVLRALAAAAGTVADGVRGAVAMLRRRDPAYLGAVAWWGFDIAVLWACFHAFGDPPPLAVLVLGYFVGTLGNLLPLPGGVGGVEGGMIGAFIGFGVPGGLALVAVLSYRAFSFWLPILPGIAAYVQLRRSFRSADAAAVS